ncbi:fumarate hydratase [Mycoplasmatota bacterium zrk1]
MRKIEKMEVIESVKRLCLDANFTLNGNILKKISSFKKTEESPIGKKILSQLEENSSIANTEKKPLCQDTGLVVVFLEMGKVIVDFDIYDAINEGVRRAYKEGYLRNSTLKHPLNRENTGDNTPAVVHTKLINADHIKITVAPKGGGSENMSRLKMLTPAEGYQGVKDFVLETVTIAEGKTCPPIIVGVGIGGNFEKSAILAKEALMRDIDDSSNEEIAKKLEKELLTEINNLGIGPMGFGGSTTALAVKVNTYPCHIAALPVAVNLQCHSARHKSVIL